MSKAEFQFVKPLSATPLTARLRTGVITVTTTVLLFGCATDPNDAYFGAIRSKANVYVAPQADHVKKVAMLPFKAQTELIGASVSDLLLTELMRAGRYEMVERGQMANVLSESELALAGLSAAKAAEVGHMLGADGVIIGSVDEYSTVAQRGHTYPVVGVSARLIDCTSSKIVWSVSLAERAQTKELTLSEQARIVIHEMTAALYNKWKP